MITSESCVKEIPVDAIQLIRASGPRFTIEAYDNMLDACHTLI